MILTLGAGKPKARSWGAGASGQKKLRKETEAVEAENQFPPSQELRPARFVQLLEGNNSNDERRRGEKIG